MTTQQSIKNLDDLSGVILGRLVGGLENYTSDHKRLINEDIVESWFGRDPKHHVSGPPSAFDDFVWRTVYLRSAVNEVELAFDWVNAIPLVKLKWGVSNQIEFGWWLYFNKISELQDRLYKFYCSARRLSKDGASREQLGKSKKAFARELLSPIKPLIDLRDHWVHDCSPDFTALARLRSLELFASPLAYGKSDKALTKLLSTEHRKLSREQKNGSTRQFRTIVLR